ncbi:MAG: alpha-ketoacid dehydrogenase subunit beta [Deltaproteobacteria bacterium]|nr:alpha-ketoacid dehydrogenase subunit beta [Deltaproteobacteria bacterium]
MPWTKIYPDKTEFEKALEKEPGLRGITFREALLEAFAELLENDPKVFIIGEGVDDAAGVFGTTKGLAERFGKARVMDTPLAENALAGIAMGAALAGLRPIFVQMRMDFTPLSMDQIINHAAKWHYMFGGALNVPLVMRGIIGRGWGSAAQHSQSLHPLFAHIPGLKVVKPSTPNDAKGLMHSAVYDGNPVIFIEHRWLYEQMGHVPKGPYNVPLGKAIVRKEGADITIVSLSHMTSEAVRAACVLEKEGISAEVVDIRTLRPLDHDTILASVKKTGRLIVAEPGWKMCGMGAEVAAIVMETAFECMKSPLVMITHVDTPTPASHVLEKAFYPGADDIAKSARRLVKK